MNYFLDEDGFGNWYLVEANKREAWYQWLNDDEIQRDEENWTPPDYAKKIEDRSINEIVFQIVSPT